MTEQESEARREDMARFLKLLPYQEARAKILQAVSKRPLPSERVPVDLALGRVSAEEVLAPSDVPSVSTSAMDGYAIRSCEAARASSSHPVTFRVVGSVSAASPKPTVPLEGLDACYVATGAPVPDGADAVVKVEETRRVGDSVEVPLSLPSGRNLVPPGDDIRAGDVLVGLGHTVNPADIAALVSVGKRDLAVVRRPRVGILSTGDELTTPGNEAEGKKANNYSNLLAGYISEAGAIPVPLGVARDENSEILRMVEGFIETLDAMVTIGGSSVGKKDFTPNALSRAGSFTEIFHGIRLVPLRPAGLVTVKGRPVVLLPGYSVAAVLSFFLVGRPIINLLSGLGFDDCAPMVRARLTEELSNARAIGALFLVKLTVDEGVYEATPLRWGSNLLSSLMSAQAYVEVGPGRTLKAGTEAAFTLFSVHEIARIPRRGPR